MSETHITASTALHYDNGSEISKLLKHLSGSNGRKEAIILADEFTEGGSGEGYYVVRFLGAVNIQVWTSDGYRQNRICNMELGRRPYERISCYLVLLYRKRSSFRR